MYTVFVQHEKEEMICNEENVKFVDNKNIQMGVQTLGL